MSRCWNASTGGRIDGAGRVARPFPCADRFMKTLRLLVPVLAIVFAVVGGCYLFSLTVHASFLHCLEARFETLPPNDKQLKAWLEAQPGVVPKKAFVSRFDPDRKVVGVMFIHVRNMAGQP